jgi:hypothetical protein
MSGLASSSHSSRRGSRPLTPLTLKLAIFNDGATRRSFVVAVRQIGQLLCRSHGRDATAPTVVMEWPTSANDEQLSDY